METKIGSEGKFVATMKEGKIVLAVEYDGKQMDAKIEIAVGANELVDALANIVPGDSALEQSIAALLKSVLAGVKI